MMRQPTSPEVLFRWYRAALAHVQTFGKLRDFDEPPTHEPCCGFFERRLVKDGPWVPGAIWMEQIYDEETGELMQPERMLCEVAGNPADPEEQWTYLCAHPIPEARYRFLHADTRWAKANAPDDSRANPTKPINPATMALQW